MIEHRLRKMKRIAAFLSSGLLLTLVVGCGGFAKAASPQVNTTDRTTNHILATNSSLANNDASAQNSQGVTNRTGPTTSHRRSNSASSTSHLNGPVVLSSHPGKIIYGSTVYSIPVPSTDKVGDLTNVTALDVPGGILWMTPPGFPDQARVPIATAVLWFTPASNEDTSIWTRATLLHQFTENQDPHIVGVTDGYVIVEWESNGTRGSTTAGSTNTSNNHSAANRSDEKHVVSYSIKDGHQVNIGTYTKLAETTWGHGAFAWTDSKYNVHVVQVSTGTEQTISWSTQPSSLQIVPGGIDVSQQFIKLALVKHAKYASVPSTFKPVYLGQAKKPVIYVPPNWTKVQQLPGGSSQGVTASNPNDPNEKVSVFLNACAGCYDPTVTSAQIINSFDSPLLGAEKGENYVWLNDHAVAYTVPPNKTEPYPTYGLTLTFPLQSGDEEIKVSVPSRDKQLAKDILNGVLSRVNNR